MKFHKQLFAAVLLSCILINCFNYWILATSFRLNKEYISTVLCSNKNHPELHCEGKCFMDIKLKEFEQKSKQEQDQLKRSIETIAPQGEMELPLIYSTDLKKSSVSYLTEIPIYVVNSVFQPPKQA